MQCYPPKRLCTLLSFEFLTVSRSVFCVVRLYELVGIFSVSEEQDSSIISRFSAELFKVTLCRINECPVKLETISTLKHEVHLHNI
jgi:hypothetical protein